MTYTADDFQVWIISIDDKMDFFTGEFAQKNNLVLDFSIGSLDQIEKWILVHYDTPKSLVDDHKMLDLLTAYIGETFRKHIGGTWFMDLKDKENAFYHMPVLTSEKYSGVKYKSPRTFATASIDRKKGNYISTILKNNLPEN